MEKRERLENAIAGRQVDRLPVSLWRHWPGDDQRAADLARASIDFQATYDWDFVRVIPASTVSAVDCGIQDSRCLDCTGDREPVKYAVTRSLEWTEIRPPDPMRGSTSKYLDALRIIKQQTNDNTPVIATVYSPLSQAMRIGGQQQLLRDMRTQADRLRTGLNTLTEGILRFIDAIKYEEIAGIAYVIEHACHTVMSESEYLEFGAAYDRKIIEMLPDKLWLNTVSLHGVSPMLKIVGSYPVQAFNWDAVRSRIDLASGKSMTRGAICGGLSAEQHLNMGTPAMIRDAIRAAANSVDGGQGLILSAETPFSVTVPQSNLRAVRETAEQITGG